MNLGFFWKNLPYTQGNAYNRSSLNLVCTAFETNYREKNEKVKKLETKFETKFEMNFYDAFFFYIFVNCVKQFTLTGLSVLFFFPFFFFFRVFVSLPSFTVY